MEGTAGKLAYLNRIDDLLNVDLAHTTSQPLFFLTPFLTRDEGVGLDRLPRPWGRRGAQRAPHGPVTAAAWMDHPSPRWLSLALTQKCQRRQYECL